MVCAIFLKSRFRRPPLPVSRPPKESFLGRCRCSPDAPHFFARLDKTVDVPNLIDIQRRSFQWLTDPQKGGLARDDRRPSRRSRTTTGNLAVQFGEFVFDEPVASLEQCREKDLT